MKGSGFFSFVIILVLAFGLAIWPFGVEVQNQRFVVAVKSNGPFRVWTTDYRSNQIGRAVVPEQEAVLVCVQAGAVVNILKGAGWHRPLDKKWANGTGYPLCGYVNPVPLSAE